MNDTLHTRIERVAADAKTGRINRAEALKRIATIQATAMRNIARASEAPALDEERCHMYDEIGADLMRPALLVQDRENRELLLPFRITPKGKVQFLPAEVAPMYTPIAAVLGRLEAGAGWVSEKSAASAVILGRGVLGRGRMGSSGAAGLEHSNGRWSECILKASREPKMEIPVQVSDLECRLIKIWSSRTRR